MPVKTARALSHHGDDKVVDKNQLEQTRLRLVVPMRLRTRVLTANHDAPSAGHRGFDKTYAAMTRLYFWFGMYADCKAWVATCPGCAKGKRRTIAGHGTAQHMGLVPTKYPPYERVVIDMIGPLPKSRDGMKYILVCVDAHSSETKLDPLKSKNSRLRLHLLQRRAFCASACNA